MAMSSRADRNTDFSQKVMSTSKYDVFFISFQLHSSTQATPSVVGPGAYEAAATFRSKPNFAGFASSMARNAKRQVSY